MSDEVTPQRARDALWEWYAHGDWEHVDLDAISDDAFDVIDDGVRAAFAGFCLVLGCVEGHGDCIYCLRPMKPRPVDV